MNNELIEKIEKIKEVRNRLKRGEYNGNDIMQAWIAIDELIDCKVALNKYHEQQQGLIGSRARLQIEIAIAESLIEDPNYEMTAMEFEYENSWLDKLKAALTKPQEVEPCWDETTRRYMCVGDCPNPHTKTLIEQEAGSKGFRLIGWTNAAQVSYIKDESGSVYPDQDHGCDIPVFIPAAKEES